MSKKHSEFNAEPKKVMLNISGREVRQFPRQADRVETGAVCFGEDWPGLFVRGDEAAALAVSLRGVMNMVDKLADLDSSQRLAFLVYRGQIQEIVRIIAQEVCLNDALKALVEKNTAGPEK